MKSAIIVLITALLISTGGYIYVNNQNKGNEIPQKTVQPVVPGSGKSEPINVFSQVENDENDTNTEQEATPVVDAKEKTPVGSNKPDAEDIISIALLGIDRRSKQEQGFRTDTIILVLANKKTNKVVLTSIPRDLWISGGRVNALFTQTGWEGLKEALTRITGLEVDNYVYTDFEDFSWIVDAMGGVTVDVERTFTDTNYPVDETKEYQTITFTQGPEKLTGERALIFARSRKGNNGEGSDWMRMRRQHLILKGMLEAVIQPESIFNPMIVEEALKTVTTGRMVTNLSLEDAKYLWDFHKDRDKYEINPLILNTTYLYNPPLEDYGGAWVLVPTDGNYNEFKTTLYSMLGENIEASETPEPIELIPEETP